MAVLQSNRVATPTFRATTTTTASKIQPTAVKYLAQPPKVVAPAVTTPKVAATPKVTTTPKVVATPKVTTTPKTTTPVVSSGLNTTTMVKFPPPPATNNVALNLALKDVKKEEIKVITPTKSETVEQQLKQYDQLVVTGKLPTGSQIPTTSKEEPIDDPQLEAAIDETIDEQAGSGAAEANRTMQKQQQVMTTETVEDPIDEDEQEEQAQAADKPKDKKKIILVILGIVAVAAALFYFPKHNH